MGFLPKKWLSALWGVNQPKTRLDPPIDCAECRIARRNGGDACYVHGEHHLRPHTYDVGHEVQWGDGVFDHPFDAMPTRESESIH